MLRKPVSQGLLPVASSFQSLKFLKSSRPLR